MKSLPYLFIGYLKLMKIRMKLIQWPQKCKGELACISAAQPPKADSE
jgi:hypothetical protein